MTDKVLCPFCPEGTEMFATYNEGGVVKWACRCGAEAPVVVRKPEESFDDAAERARVLALRRYEPENRVLTLEEVRETINAPLWLEFKKAHVNDSWSVRCKNDFERTPFFFHAECAEKMEYREDKYGVSWRCWLRKPTEEDRKVAHWAE